MSIVYDSRSDPAMMYIMSYRAVPVATKAADVHGFVF